MFFRAADESAWVGALRLEIVVPGARSLKDRRMGVAHVRDRLRARGGFSVAEVGHRESHDRAVLAVVSVGHDPTELRAAFDKVAAEVESWGKVLVASRHFEIAPVFRESQQRGPFSGIPDAEPQG